MDDIIRMAQEAQQERLSLDGRSPSTLSGYWFSMEVADLARFAALVRADERKGLRICDEAIPALRAALTEPVQEPVEPNQWQARANTRGRL